MGFLDKLKSSLARARDHIRARIVGPEVDFDTIESALLAADFGLPMTRRVLEAVRAQAREKPTLARENVFGIVRDEVEKALGHPAPPLSGGPPEAPRVILVVGVNGTGKTTTIAKLASLLLKQGKSVLVGAADTFRAAAIDQLRIWCDRLKIGMVGGEYGADPASVAHDAVARARREAVDVLLVDTAGRLHNKANLMRELEKVHRVIGKQMPGAPHDVWLVIDATTGTNAFSQAREFHESLGVTGLIITKLDGTSRGGMVVSIQQNLGIPVLFIGVGEQLDDLQPFESKAFVEALFE